MVNKIKADPKLALYRAAVQQRAEAKATGGYDHGRDMFFAASDFTGGLLMETNNVLTISFEGTSVPETVAIGETGTADSPPLAIHYAFFKLLEPDRAEDAE